MYYDNWRNYLSEVRRWQQIRRSEELYCDTDTDFSIVTKIDSDEEEFDSNNREVAVEDVKATDLSARTKSYNKNLKVVSEASNISMAK